MEQQELIFTARPQIKRKRKKMTVDELLAHIESHQADILSGKLCARKNSEITGWSRYKIRDIAKKNGLAYKKQDEQNFFSVPLGIWNQKLSS